MQFAVATRNLDTKEETIKKFPSFEEAREYALAKNPDGFRDLVVLKDDRIFFLEETSKEDPFLIEEDQPEWFCYSKEDWLASLNEFLPILSLSSVLLLSVDRFHGEWLNKDFSAYEKPEDWEVSGTEIWRSGDFVTVKVGFYNDSSGTDICSVNFLLYSPVGE